MRNQLALFFVFFFDCVHAFEAFDTECPLPNNDANYVSGPNTRGTMDIVWGCFSVLILCTWTIQHLSVPSHEEDEARKIRRWGHGFRRKSRHLLTKLKWMIITIVGPEYIVGKALTERLAAHYSRSQFNCDEWSTTHGHFANMRGFVLRFRAAAVPTSLTPTSPTKLGQSRFQLRQFGEPPYYEQDQREAKFIEMDHCRDICGEPCKNQPGNANPETESLVGPPSISLLHVEGNREETEQPSARSAPLTVQTEIIMEKNPPIRHAATMPSPRTTQPRISPTTPGTPLPRYTPVQHTPPTRFPALFRAEPIAEDRPDTPERKHSTNKLPVGPHKVWAQDGLWPLNSDQMHHAFTTGLIDFPPITVGDLSDRSKGDALVRIATMLQITWLVVQIIARSFQDLSITLLEVTVLAFAACALATYALLWRKPQDVGVPVYVPTKRVLTRQDVIGLAARSPVSSLIGHEFWLHGVAVRAQADNIWPHSPGLRVHIPYLMRAPFFFNPIVVGIGLGGAAFGAVHFAAWSFDSFPTEVERLLWRLACIALVGLPPVGISIYWVGTHYRKTHAEIAPRVTRVLKPFAYALMPIYLLARLFLLVEVFRSLPYLPPSAYQQVRWPTVIPHAI